MITVGDRIRQRRAELGFTVAHLAKLLGVSPSTVTRYETGAIQAFRPETIIHLAECLQCAPSYIMGFNGPKLILSPLAEKVAFEFERAPEKERNVVCAILSISPAEKKSVMAAAKGGGTESSEVDSAILKKTAKTLRSIPPKK